MFTYLQTYLSNCTFRFIHVACGRGGSSSSSVAMLCISGFVDDQCFLTMGPIAQKIRQTHQPSPSVTLSKKW